MGYQGEKSRRRRLLISVGSLLVVLGIFLWYFGPQAILVLEARYLAHRTPVVKQTPSALSDTSVSEAVGTSLSYFGYEFKVPWADIDTVATKVYPKRVVIAFKSGLRLMFVSGPPKEFVKTVLSSGQVDRGTFQRVYGDVVESDYSLTRFMLESTPDKVTLLTSKKDAVGGAMMLVIKAIAVPTDSGMFSVTTADFKGFQYGEPRSPSKKIIVDLFADDGSVEFLFFRHDPGPPTSLVSIDRPVMISQSEINSVVQSVRAIASKHNEVD
jgi:hypothetical protein